MRYRMSAVALGRMGGKARADHMSAKRRKDCQQGREVSLVQATLEHKK